MQKGSIELYSAIHRGRNIFRTIIQTVTSGITNSRTWALIHCPAKTSVLSQYLTNQIIIIKPLTMDLHGFLGCSFYLLRTVTWLGSSHQLREPSWRVNVKLIAHHSMLIAEARLRDPNKQPAGSTNLPCFALLKLYWAQYGNSINSENDTGKCHWNCNQLFFP